MCACVYVIGCLAALTWLTVALSWQGGWPDGMWALDTADIFEGGGVG